MITSISFLLSATDKSFPYRTYRDLKLFKDCTYVIQRVMEAKQSGNLEINLTSSNTVSFSYFVDYLQNVHDEDTKNIKYVTKQAFAKQTSQKVADYLELLTKQNQLRAVFDIAYTLGHTTLYKLIVAWMVHKSYKMDVNEVAKMLTFTTRFTTKQQEGLALEQCWCE